jgi:hypothetical protein
MSKIADEKTMQEWLFACKPDALSPFTGLGQNSGVIYA